MSNLVTKNEFIEYIAANPVATLGTVNEDGSPLGTIIYITAIDSEKLYFVTKSETLKFQNVLKDNQVSITVANLKDSSTLQAGGTAEVVRDASVINSVMADMARIYGHSADYLPPITKIRAGAYQVVEISIKVLQLATFKGARAGDPHIFKEK